MDYYNAFPFYSGYRDMPYHNGTVYQGYDQLNQAIVQQPIALPEDRILEDMEYLQQMYPTYAKKYQGVIGSVVDKMDYEGSFIYDQYPDKLTIQRMVASVMTVIKSNEERDGADMIPIKDEENGGVTDNTLTEKAPWSEKEPWIRELVTVLMYYEILARRKRRQKRYWIMQT